MASRPNANIGTVDCPARHCDRKDAHVRKMAKGRRAGQLYVQCPDCGPVMLRGAAFQDWCLERATMNGPPKPPPEPPKPAPAPEPAPAPVPAPTPVKKPFSLWD